MAIEFILFFLREQFYKNSGAKIPPKIRATY